MAEIPTTKVVYPQAGANAEAAYDGAPRFAPIAGTAMQYATNTWRKMIEMDGFTTCA
jgi:hypothetical protein